MEKNRKGLGQQFENGRVWFLRSNGEVLETIRQAKTTLDRERENIEERNDRN